MKSRAGAIIFLVFSAVIIAIYVYYKHVNISHVTVSAAELPASAQSDSDIIHQISSDMVLIEGGGYLMGCSAENDTDCEDYEGPPHRVQVSSFYLSRYHVTVKQFQTFVSETGYKTIAERKGYGSLGNMEAPIRIVGLNWRYNERGMICADSEMNHPVIQISWYDAVEYCRWVSAKTGLNFRLATSAEYEFASRGGVKSLRYKYPGSNNIDEVSWYKKNSGGRLHAVGQKKPNELGLYDMNGLVYTWCSDWMDLKYYSVSPIVNPGGPETGTIREVRGGAFNRPVKFLHIELRHARVPDIGNANCGFRIARDI